MATQLHDFARGRDIWEKEREYLLDRVIDADIVAATRKERHHEKKRRREDDADDGESSTKERKRSDNILNSVFTSASILRRSEENTSELQSLIRTSYAVFCFKKKNKEAIKSKNTNK